MLQFTNMDIAGFITQFLSEDDPRPAREQIHENYAHGGGWNKFEGFELRNSGTSYGLKYPGDPVMREVSRAQLRDETLVLFECSWLAIIQPDGSYEVARID